MILFGRWQPKDAKSVPHRSFAGEPGEGKRSRNPERQAKKGKKKKLEIRSSLLIGGYFKSFQIKGKPTARIPKT